MLLVVVMYFGLRFCVIVVVILILLIVWLFGFGNIIFWDNNVFCLLLKLVKLIVFVDFLGLLLVRMLIIEIDFFGLIV